MRRKNKCSIYVDDYGIFAHCTSISEVDCKYSDVNSKLQYCRYSRHPDCRNKEAANDAAYRIVKKIQKKFWC